MAQKDVFTEDFSTAGSRGHGVLESGAVAQLAPVPSSAPVPPQNLEATTCAWAAGLFEGEGSIAIRQNSTVMLTLASTDADVVFRFRAVVGTGRLSSQAPGRNGRHKRLWRVDITEVAEVLRVIETLYPWLGSRRRARADEAVRILNERVRVATAERSCVFCGRLFEPPFTPNAARTKFCRRLCERRWHQKKRTLSLVVDEEQLQ